ncbi:TIM-barrel domain-containing protein [uncultured Serinicoccus sp.]|uniref:TIM-barrel domain-containing protein n=1 Tax=uncultured Serinicoccus sp. TaxID=735514 RepID=UPI002638154C|nr:TIM-barrel domain-containing protein [uncultured Serinicoccus sp.]
MPIVHQNDRCRLTALTPHLLRIEWSPSGTFTDDPTQVVVDRDLWGADRGELPLQVEPWRGGVRAVSDGFEVRYDGADPSAAGLSVQARGGLTSYHSTWRFGEPVDAPLPGTTRTLDDADGPVPLEPSILSRSGLGVLDDSRSLVRTGPELTDLTPREPGAVDLYVFTHGLDFRGALRDFHALTGPVPRVPRFVLGNWWSRYHPYSADEYAALLDRFAADRLPFSVAVIDMDWHLVDVDPQIGSGWTGYTWNRELFPDPQAFLDDLHRRGLKVTLNDHPADGVRRHEDAYPAMARAMGIDPASGEPVEFDPTSERFWQAFFTHVAGPLAEQGVDFWWIDWQQGTHTALPGLDPLWLLNERHFAQQAADGLRPLVFSRYAGPGSHRTPIGFSGDSLISWESLAFQPEFTASAANIGYGWWSHDIGGHWAGAKDVELAVRWVQLGVWSPVNRLHASASPFQGKEPWRFGPEGERLMGEALRLRHRLLPYLATMAERAAVEGISLVEPVYHRHPGRPEAYAHRATFFFGEDLLCAPAVTPRLPGVELSATPVWLPPGQWSDLETGRRYDAGEHGRELTAYRDLGSTAVFARVGTVLPLTGGEPVNGVDLPEHLELVVFPGADGRHLLVEDDDGPEATRLLARTPLRWDDAGRRLVVGPGEGDLGVLPATRTWSVRLAGSDEVHTLRDVPVGEQVSVELPDPGAPDVLGECFALLDAAQVEHAAKERAWVVLQRGLAEGGGGPARVADELRSARLDDALVGALTEIVTAG